MLSAPGLAAIHQPDDAQDNGEGGRSVDMRSAVAELRSQGVVVIRHFLSPSIILNLKQLVERAYTAAEIGTASKEVCERVTAWGGINVHFMDQAGIAQDDISKMLMLVERRAHGGFGRCRIIPEICVFRKHRECRTHIPWHIDADGAGTSPYEPCLNIWLPFVAVGRLRPSLEVVLGSHILMRELPLLDPSYASRTDEWVDSRFERKRRFVANMKPGDALVFDHYTLHRTQPMKYQSGDRLSGEFRIQLITD
jgi:hypothetical protein